MIQQANRILDWQENLSVDDIPPEHMWLFEDQLEAWFKDVDQKREERYSTDGSSGGGDDEGGWIKNELAEGRGE